MQSYGQHQLRLINQRNREQIDEASRARLATGSDRPSLRRSIGHSMIRIGRRLASDPQAHRAGSAALSR